MSVKSFSNLPTELLHEIFTHLSIDLDHLLSCALVCVSWQHAARLFYLLYPRLKSDALLILLPPENQTGRQCCRIYNYCSRKIHRIFLPQRQGRWYTASSHGWLLTVANQTIHLLNPITNATVKLPPGKRFSKREIFRMSSKKPESTRVITSIIPTDPLCEVLAIHPGKHGHSFSFCRTGDHAWIRINNFVGRCSDAIFYKSDFYAIDFYGYIWVIQPTVNNFQKAVKLSVEPVQRGCRCYYLVEVKGDLLMVVKRQWSLSACYIYRMDWEKKSWVWMEELDCDVYLGRFCSYWEVSQSMSYIFFLDDAPPTFASPESCCAIGCYIPRFRQTQVATFSAYDPPPPQEAVEGICTANWISWYKLDM